MIQSLPSGSSQTASNHLTTDNTDPERIDAKVALREGLRSEDVAEAAVFMLSRPPHVAIRDLVMLPQALDI